MAVEPAPTVIVPALVKLLLSKPCMPRLLSPTAMVPLLIAVLPLPRLIAVCPLPTVIEAVGWTVSARLFSVPVPNPVLLAPSQVTVLPDCTQAATACLAGIATVTAADNNDKEASVRARSDRALAMNAGSCSVFIRAASLLEFINFPPLAAEAAVASKRS
ncbi:hypothetical protein Q2941_22145 [Bradyrhizobium sp. UFLA05-153]